MDSSNPNIYTEVQEHDGTGILSLVVRSISKSMAGNYTCQTNFEGNTYSQTHNIEAYDSPYFVNTTEDQNIIIGEDTIVRCEVRGIADYEIVWYRITDRADVLLGNDIKYNILPERGLMIRNVSKEDAGYYNCTVNNIITGDSVALRINVQAAARPVIYEPKFNVPPETIVVGSSVVVECLAEAIPYPEYTWTKITDEYGNQLEEANSTWTPMVNTIKFDNIQKEDAGTYVCTAANSVDTATIKVVINVKVPPVITSLENATVVEGSVAQIACKATGVPVPVLLIETSVDGLETDPRVSTAVLHPTPDTSELYLTIMNVTRDCEGVFRCSAANEVNNVTQEMYLTVLYAPYFPIQNETVWGWQNHTVNMSCVHTSNPPSTIVWKYLGNEGRETTTAEHDEVNKRLQELSDGSPDQYLALQIDDANKYGEYECSAVNAYGNSTKKIYLREAFKPMAIKNATPIASTATSITFHIQGPEAIDNAPIRGYVAEYDLVENYAIISHHNISYCGIERNFTIDRLKPNRTYSIRFAAQNAVGDGEWSAPMEFTTPESSVPEPPTEVWGHQGKLKWKAPESNGEPIDHYNVEFCPFDGKVVNRSLCQQDNVSDTTFPLEKLERNAKYNFSIRAHNAQGYSGYTYKEIKTPAKIFGEGLLSAGAVIGISVVAVFLCLLVLDLLLLCWRKQGIIASCFLRKNKKKTDNINSRDKKGLLVTEGERTDDRPNNGGHRELVYNKTTGVITGKHSSV
ncbi:fasciclin-2-like isoform X2 [Leguminivora glycinivorella]|uniref:fasciclin-2-like isoform X2 n=1 Tax=Leguminivora glycinivorella TaxID=1035111 RepID=UPI00200D2C59|nr:fasciclin-2-like isoform X2 [Leguminivora glycinivorella]